jgi:hypothetical protein
MWKKLGAGGRKRKRQLHKKGPAPSVLPNLFIYLLFYFWTYEELLGILGEWVYNTSIF